MPATTNSLIARTLLAVPALATALLLQAASAQGEAPAIGTGGKDQTPSTVAYPERDALSPFRSPTDIYAPPDELFDKLRIMQNIAAGPNANKSYNERGCEVVDDPVWLHARTRVAEIGLNAGMLAQMMRLHRNALQRDTAFYAAFYVDNLGYVMDLISHIPGEPQRSVREAAFPRAIEFLRVHLPRRFGNLSAAEKEAVLAAMPELGSPAAKSQGLTRAPVDSDHLHALRLTPFFQLLDLDDELDQAQGLWFLKEVFRIRPDLANLWLEPALPRLQHLLLHGKTDSVRAEATAIYQQIGPKNLPAPPAEPNQLAAWASQAAKHMFPPIRNINDAIVQLFPSPEREAIVTAAVRALENSAIGDPYRGQRKDGSWYSGFRIGYVPDELKALAIPADAVITSVNGAQIGSAQELLKVSKKLVLGSKRPRRIFVEYVLKDSLRAIEFRVM